jgi:hypothetical protein
MKHIVKTNEIELNRRDFSNLTIHDIWVLCNRIRPLREDKKSFKSTFIGSGTIIFFGCIVNYVSLRLVSYNLPTTVSRQFSYRYIIPENPDATAEINIYVSLKDLRNYNHFRKIMNAKYKRIQFEDRINELITNIITKRRENEHK